MKDNEISCNNISNNKRLQSRSPTWCSLIIKNNLLSSPSRLLTQPPRWRGGSPALRVKLSITCRWVSTVFVILSVATADYRGSSSKKKTSSSYNTNPQQSQLIHYPERKIAEFQFCIKELENEYKRFIVKLRALDPTCKHKPWTPRAYSRRRADTQDSLPTTSPLFFLYLTKY